MSRHFRGCASARYLSSRLGRIRGFSASLEAAVVNLFTGSPAGSRRAVWGERAMGIGAFLSFLYTMLLSMLLSVYYYIPNTDAILGYSY